MIVVIRPSPRRMELCGATSAIQTVLLHRKRSNIKKICTFILEFLGPSVIMGVVGILGRAPTRPFRPFRRPFNIKKSQKIPKSRKKPVFAAIPDKTFDFPPNFFYHPTNLSISPYTLPPLHLLSILQHISIIPSKFTHKSIQTICSKG